MATVKACSCGTCAKCKAKGKSKSVTEMYKTKEPMKARRQDLQERKRKGKLVSKGKK
jgi:hypothetical protein